MYTLLKKIPTGEQAHNYNFQNPEKRGPRGYDPSSALRLTKNGQILWKRPFYSMIRPKNVQKQEKHDFVICPPILKNFQNVKIDKSISAL